MSEELGHISYFVPSLKALKNKKKLCFLKPWLLSQLPKINFYVPFLPPRQPFGPNCLKLFLSLFLKWTISPSRHLFLTSICTAVPFHGRKAKRALLSWWLSEESSCLLSGLNPLLTLLWQSLEVPPNLSGSLRQWSPETLTAGSPANCLQSCPSINQKCALDHRTQKAQAEVQLPKIFLERQWWQAWEKSRPAPWSCQFFTHSKNCLRCTSGRPARWVDRQDFSEVSSVWIWLPYKNLGAVLGAAACVLEKSTCKHTHNAPASKADRNTCIETTCAVERKGTQTNSPRACLRTV